MDPKACIRLIIEHLNEALANGCPGAPYVKDQPLQVSEKAREAINILEEAADSIQDLRYWLQRGSSCPKAEFSVSFPTSQDLEVLKRARVSQIKEVCPRDKE